MLFNSLTFLIFLVIVFLLYWYLFNRNLKWQNIFVVAISYLFYGWWDWRFLLLIALTSTCSWFSGIWIEKIRSAQTIPGEADPVRLKCRWVTVANIMLNLVILAFFKYFNFFEANFIHMFQTFGIELNSSSLKLILPVGISFYTFQALSYSIDVYRKKIEPCHDIVSFFAFVSFFPQLVAGPIERSTQLLPQFYQPRTFNYANALDGLRQALWGFFKKIVIADNCASYANQIFEHQQDASGSMLLLGGIFFTFQIYGDFSGYSDIAIGVSRLFGFNLMRNFNYPYFSRDIAEFWRRWHISLTTWFRDYLYIPLGGSRRGLATTIRNVLIIFIVSGLWHGANWTFIIWGAYNGLLFIPLLLTQKNRQHTDTVAFGKRLPSIKEMSQITFTFSLVVIGWIIFRSDHICEAWNYISRMFSSTLFSIPRIENYYMGHKDMVYVLLFISVLLIVEWIQRNKQHGLQIDMIRNKPVRWSIYYCILILILAYSNNQQSFIYFQF